MAVAPKWSHSLGYSKYQPVPGQPHHCGDQGQHSIH